MSLHIDIFFWAWLDLIPGDFRKGHFADSYTLWALFRWTKQLPEQLSDPVVFEGFWRLVTSTILVARSPCACQIQGSNKYYLGVQILLADQIHSSQFLYQIHLAGQTHFDHFSYQIHLADQIHSAGQDPWSKSLDWSTPAVLDRQAVRAT